jgi:ABC-2 type transport system permease protein
MGDDFARLGAYLRFICRRERATSAIWVVCLAACAVSFAALYPGILPTQAQIAQLAAMMSNPAMVALMGEVYGPENLTQASMMAQECLIWYLVATAVMNVFLVNRHTRVDEELGRLEMFRALPVGRLTGALATAVFAFLVDLAVSLLVAAGLVALDVEGTTVAGAFVFGSAIGAVGFAFAGLTLLLAQLFSTARGVSGAGFALLGLGYVLRALGDVRGGALSYASPFGLGLRVEAFHSDALAPVAVLLVEGVCLVGVALAICVVRDHGSGILPARRGRANASRLLRGPFGLAWRLCRGTVLGWGAGMLLLGASYGSVCSSIDDFVAGNEMIGQIVGASGSGTLVESYVAMVFSMMSLVASVPVVLAALRIHGEERHGRLEQVLGRSVSRLRLHGGFLAVAAVGGVAMQALFAVGFGAMPGVGLGMGTLLGTGLGYLPAIWAMAGLAVLLVGLLPKLTALVWAVFGYTFVVLYLGRVVDLPEWMAKVTPFGNVPLLPVQDLTVPPLVVLALVAAALTALGMWGFKARDLDG